MQSSIIHILILGCLVLLFYSVYRKRPTPTVRSWVVGWILILVHYFSDLWRPAGELAHRSLSAVSTGSLLLCGAAFLLPLLERRTAHKSDITLYSATAACLSALSIIILEEWGVTSSLLYYVAIAIGQTCWTFSLLRLPESRTAIRVTLIAANLMTVVWMIMSVYASRPDVAVSAMLCQVFLCVAALYVSEAKRISAGILTVVCSLISWAAVFPLAEAFDHLHLLQRIDPEFWNIPKFFVAFGMILTLFEEEVLIAKETGKYYKLLFENNPLAMWIYDQSSLAFDDVNDAAVAQYGYTRGQFQGLSLRDVEGANCRESSGTDYPAADFRGPLLHRKQNGSEFLVDVASRSLRRDDRQLVLSSIQDVTEREHLHARLKEQATHDTLTGLQNRAYFEEQLHKTLSHSERYGRHAALLCLDVDRFKQINDTYGHDVGDACLKEVSSRLAHRIRNMDTVARTGGEEFCVLLHEISDLATAERVASDILLAFESPVTGPGYTIEMTASIGIAICPHDGSDAATLWRHADTAMYQAKKAGGDRVASMSAEVRAKMSHANQIEFYLRRALKQGALELHYQPLYRMTGELHSLEALLRVRRSDGALISPGDFIPVAEDVGMIVPLDKWVLNEVCRQLAEWKSAGLKPPSIAINVSVLEITRPDYADHVIDVLSSHSVDPELLGIEITETAIMRNLAEASRQIKRLAAIGVAFSVDDFGTGYSSLGQLDRLPVQALKIDQSFINRLGDKSGTYSIVDAIISMSGSLSLKVVAEGVETKEQLSCLRHLGCDLVQGFYFSKPLSVVDTEELLRSAVSA